MEDDDLLTFEELRKVRKKAKEEDSLQNLNEDFLKRLKEYLDRKKRLNGKLDGKEYRNAKRITEDIIDLRERKILKRASLSVRSNVEVNNLLEEEKPLFEKVKQSIKLHREIIDDNIYGEGSKVEDENEEVEKEEKGKDKKISGEINSASEEKAEEEESEGEIEESEEEKTPSEKKEESEKGKNKGSKELEEISKDGIEKQKVESEKDGKNSRKDEEKEKEFNDKEKDSGEEEDEKGSEKLEKAEEVEKDQEKEEKGEENRENYKKVKVTSEVPEFLGTDLKSYGPLEKGEKAEIPEENAKVLMKRDKAEEIKK